MDHRSGPKRTGEHLFPPIEPFDRRMIDMGDGHVIYVEQCGNPQGQPVMVLHGGPGGGCSPGMRRFFDPEIWRIVLFDQRGCGRSRPLASVTNNTTWHLVQDIEHIADSLGIARFVSFGGSWGATLALIHAITHPARVQHLVLRGVFLMMQRELDWFYRGGGAGDFFPELWERFLAPLPLAEQNDPIAGYNRRLFSGDIASEIRHAQLWSGWENALASIESAGRMIEGPAEHARSFARLENHYFAHAGWLESDGWILQNRHRIAHLGADIIQGRNDMICPPRSAFELARGWPGARLRMVPAAGHAMSEPRIAAALLDTTDRLGHALLPPRP